MRAVRGRRRCQQLGKAAGPAKQRSAGRRKEKSPAIAITLLRRYQGWETHRPPPPPAARKGAGRKREGRGREGERGREERERPRREERAQRRAPHCAAPTLTGSRGSAPEPAPSGGGTSVPPIVARRFSLLPASHQSPGAESERARLPPCQSEADTVMHQSQLENARPQ